VTFVFIQVWRMQGYESAVWGQIVAYDQDYSPIMGCVSHLLYDICIKFKNKTKEGDMIKVLAREGHIECIKYLHKIGWKLSKEAANQAVTYGHLECLKYIYQHKDECGFTTGSAQLSITAAKGGHLDCLEFLFENKLQWWSYAVCFYAAREGKLECVKYGHKNGASLGPALAYIAATHGHLDCLKYLHENGCTMDSSVCTSAAKNGFLKCLEYLHEIKGPWDAEACAAASQNGFLDCLKYLHENGCPWDAQTCHTKHGDCYDYASDNGCPS